MMNKDDEMKEMIIDAMIEDAEEELLRLHRLLLMEIESGSSKALIKEDTKKVGNAFLEVAKAKSLLYDDKKCKVGVAKIIKMEIKH